MAQEIGEEPQIQNISDKLASFHSSKNQVEIIHQKKSRGTKKDIHCSYVCNSRVDVIVAQ